MTIIFKMIYAFLVQLQPLTTISVLDVIIEFYQFVINVQMILPNVYLAKFKVCLRT